MPSPSPAPTSAPGRQDETPMVVDEPEPSVTMDEEEDETLDREPVFVNEQLPTPSTPEPSISMGLYTNAKSKTDEDVVPSTEQVKPSLPLFYDVYAFANDTIS